MNVWRASQEGRHGMSFRIGQVVLGVPDQDRCLVVYHLRPGGVDAPRRLLPQLFPDAPASVNWVTRVISSLLFFASVLVHGWAHYVAIRNGLDVGGITLFSLRRRQPTTREPRSPELS